jgi:hypothetical protein
MAKQEVIKHSSAIQITNTIGLIQRRAWNILLATAYDDLIRKDFHTIRISDLIEQLGVSSHNYDYLKELLKSLQTTAVQWNFLGKDGKNKWGSYPLLGGIEFDGTWCHYTFDNLLRKWLHNPRIYARINLSIQNRFNSKHSLALYELAVDYFDLNRLYGETPFMEIDRFRQLMGLGDGEYEEYKYLNHWVIKPAVKEINKKSDLLVEVQSRKKGRRVEAIKMVIRRNPQKMDSLIAPTEPKPARTLFPDLNDEQDAFDNWLAELADDKRLKVRQMAISRLSPEERELFAGEEKSWAIEAQVQMYMRKIWQDETEGSALGEGEIEIKTIPEKK